MNQVLQPLVATILGMVLLLGLAGCNRAVPANAPSSDEDASPPLVRLLEPERRTLRHIIEQPGHIQAFEQTPVHARIAGHVQQVCVDIGYRVRKGDLLAELWVPDLEVELRQKQALVGQAQAQLTMTREAVPIAEAECKRTRRQLERLTRVGKTGVLDQENVDEAQYGSEASKGRLETARADVTVKKAQLEVARRNRDYAATMLQFAKIVAPFDGVVTKRNVDPGHFVQPQAGNGITGQPLFVVMHADPVRIFVDVPELDASELKEGSAAQVRVQGLKDRLFAGKVVQSSWALDPVTRTLRAEIQLPNPQGILRPGMYAQVQVVVEHRDVWAVPASLVLTERDQKSCFQVEGGKAVATPVRVGVQDGPWIEVLQKQVPGTGGEAPGRWTEFTGQESIIDTRSLRLAPGQPVALPGVP